MKKIKISKLKRFRERISIKDIIGILIGSFILAWAIQFLLVPAHLLTGGVTGLAIILKFLTGYNLSIFYIALNIPIFIIGFRFVSGRFALYSLLGMFAVSGFLALTELFNFKILIDDILLSAILGGVLTGVGTGINLRSKGSSGGLDIIAVIVKRYWGYYFGETFFVINLIVLAMFLLTSNIELTFYSALSIFVTSKVVDTVESGLSVTRSAMIVSQYADDIAYEIIHNMNRGCTYLTGEGAYTGDKKNIIMATVGKTQLPRLKEIVFHIDPEAFITVNETVEVYGQGFKSSAADF